MIMLIRDYRFDVNQCWIGDGRTLIEETIESGPNGGGNLVGHGDLFYDPSHGQGYGILNMVVNDDTEVDRGIMELVQTQELVIGKGELSPRGGGTTMLNSNDQNSNSFQILNQNNNLTTLTLFHVFLVFL